MNSAKERGRVGLIGIGAMGFAMARNLIERGYPVAVRDIRASVEEDARAQGMMVCRGPGEVVEVCDPTLIVVVNAAQIDAVISGADGIAQARAAGKTVILCSTIAPHDAVRFAAQLAASGVETLDGPISGGPARAADGSMSMMLAGSDSVLEPWNELLADMAEKRFRVGTQHGDAAKAKLVNNLLAGINLVAAAESLALGVKLGLDPAMLFALISASSGSSWVFQDRMRRAIDNDFQARAATHILTKDVGLALDLAQSVEHATPLGRVALERLRSTIAGGWGELDDAAVIKTYLD